MIKAVLQHPGGSVDLREGEIVIGRGLGCPIRFNDHTVSRKHVKIIVTADRITVRDLGSRNGTKLNNEPLLATKTLEDRDVLQVGSVRLRLSMITSRQTFMDEAVTSPGAFPEDEEPALRALSKAAWGGVSDSSHSRDTLVDKREALAQAQVETEPMQLPGSPRRRSNREEPGRGVPAAKFPAITLVPDSGELPLPELIARTCPDCRKQVPMAQQQCDGCGYKWQLRGPLSKTQPIIISSLSELGLGLALDQEQHDRAMERRVTDRVELAIPVIYHSENLTFDARAQNLSRSGMFIASDLLDAVGTPCMLRVLPDGHAAISITGVVKHVITSTNAVKDQIPGMGIRFQKMSHGTLSWIWSVLGDPLEA